MPIQMEAATSPFPFRKPFKNSNFKKKGDKSEMAKIRQLEQKATRWNWDFGCRILDCGI